MSEAIKNEEINASATEDSAEAAEDTTAAEAAKSDYIVEFKKPFRFRGNEYDSIDLSGLENLTVKDLCEVQADLINDSEVAAALLMETTVSFACAMAARAAKKDPDFFRALPARSVKAVQKAVLKAINKEQDDDTPGVLTFAQPYVYTGARKDIKNVSFTQVRFEGGAELTAADLAAAENKMARSGQPVTNTVRNYIYACCIAARASSMPEDFFTGLPACEGMKLLNVVNGEDFFG